MNYQEWDCIINKHLHTHIHHVTTLNFTTFISSPPSYLHHLHKMHASPIKLLALSASTVSAAVHVVKVGENGLNFTPAQTSAKIGDTVEFHFYEGFHSVAQSSFAKPCEPINSTAFFSGDQNVKTKVSDKVFTIEVKTDDPIWYYCAVQGHCQGGMVGAINAP